MHRHALWQGLRLRVSNPIPSLMCMRRVAVRMPPLPEADFLADFYRLPALKVRCLLWWRGDVRLAAAMVAATAAPLAAPLGAPLTATLAVTLAVAMAVPLAAPVAAPLVAALAVTSLTVAMASPMVAS
jgi:hypothetical protein